jgi:hypothetical protein
MPGSTSRLALPYPLPAAPNNFPSDIQALATKLDSIGAAYALGVETARPAFGTAGRFYISSDSGKLFVDNGTSWSQVNYSPTQLFSAKGDLLIASAAMAGARLGAGADGQVLVARSTATLGVDWETVVGQALELTGATAATRYVGGTTTGAPTTGTFALGDFVITQDGNVWVCTTAGAPGVWRQPGAAPLTPQGLILAAGLVTPTRAISDVTSGLVFGPSSAEFAYPVMAANSTVVKSITVIGSGSTGTYVRLGIRAATASNLPGVLITDAGTVVLAGGSKTVIIPNGGVSLTPGALYYAVCTVDNNSNSTCWAISHTASSLFILPGNSIAQTADAIAYYDTTASSVSASNTPLRANYGTAPSVVYGNNGSFNVPHQWWGC